LFGTLLATLAISIYNKANQERWIMNLSHMHGQHLIQSPMTSAHIAQTMTLLYMTSTELLQTIDVELSKNPALELINERRCPMCGRKLPPQGPCPICSQPKTLDPDETIVFVSPRDDFYSYNGHSSKFSDDLLEEPFASNDLDLPTYVLQQVAPELDSDERELAAMILTNLDVNGFLAIEVREICRFHHVPPSKVDAVLDKIQRCDPLGVSARNVKEALLAQVDFLSKSSPVPEFVRRAISEEFDLLSKRQFSEVAKKLNTTVQQIKQVSSFISENLNPYPARTNWGNFRQPNENTPEVYHQPDVLIYYLNNKPNNPLVIEIITPSRGTLRLNPLFKNALKQQSSEKKEEWKKDLDKASLLIKCIQQRNNTMRQLMERMVAIQKSFIIHGETHLAPLTRAQIAEELDVHESTISRAVANKTVQLPNKKIIPMSTFFDRSLAVRAIMRNIIENERHALNDTEIRKSLERQGINIARRTVAKYRAMEGILPAHLRRIEKFATA
jgi:RNA polymerase sigma-54 factor